ncbi:MAG: TonB-dependent receptor, partial [Bacteroidia bacterium]|nr:TonB-dependent receptor [Bacteroidia bacterium]
KDSAFVSGTMSNEEGRFTFNNLKQGKYFIEITFLGYIKKKQPLFVGSLTEFLDLAAIEIEENKSVLNEVVITSKQDDIAQKLDKKTFTLADNISQNGGSVLQSMQNLPGVTVQDGKVQLRGNDKVMVLIDGKQTALTGFGNQTSLDNIPASSIEKIEIINNPSAKFDANGNAGIINIIYKKNKQEGFNGKVGLVGGLGALWIKNANYPSISDQFQNTPKVNPSLSLNYKKQKINLFFQGDYLYTQTLNKNEFVERTYNDGTIIKQQTKRNRTTTVGTAKLGFDYNINSQNSLTISGLFSSEKILDNGDEPFFNGDFSERKRLWQFLEDELKTTATATAAFQHKFKQPGHLLNAGFNYTFHREDEKYFFTNIMPTFTGKDAFKLLSDEYVFDVNFDYTKPLKYGKIEGGIKIRRRSIPTNMQFLPGLNSPLDTNAGGWANYDELIPAVYGNYVFENKLFELEAGLRLEYVDLQYQVNPNHNTYKSNGYNYTQPFPNIRLAYKINDDNKISFFYNRRVDRPNEVDIRIFPKYDDAEIVKIGNPALRPQFTNSLEVGYKRNMKKGYFYSAAYLKLAEATITRIASIAPGNTIIYNIMQNAGNSYLAGIEVVLSQNVNKWFTYNFNLNGYQNQIDAFTVINKYPTENVYTANSQQIFSGNVKWNGLFHLPKKTDLQISAVYLAPDIIPQGKMGARFSLDVGVKKAIQKGKGEVFLNATDLLNTMVIYKEVNGDGFKYLSRDYYETQVLRLGYNYKF